MTMAFDPTFYNDARRGINADFQAKSAANAYSQRLAQQRGRRNITDLRQSFSRGVPGVVGSYSQRGLTGAVGGGMGGGVRSGVYNQALQDYAANNFRAVQDQQNEIASSRDQFRLSQAQLQAAQQAALADLQARKRAEIAAAAAQLVNGAR